MLDVRFVGLSRMRSLNRSFMGKDRSTDVLSFPQFDWSSPARPPSATTVKKLVGQPFHLGDIVICPDRAKANAQGIGHSLDREVCFLLIHGLLHLCGYDHMSKKDEQPMLKQQRRIMSQFSKKRPPLWSGCIRNNSERKSRK